MTVKQITQEQYDERFYFDEDKTNIVTKNHYFPSVTYLLGFDAMTPQLKEWLGNKGYEESLRILNKRADIGSYVHNAIEKMLLEGKPLETRKIDEDIKDVKEALFVKRCLLGMENFVKESECKILCSEYNIIADDYAGTIDLKMTFPKDDHKTFWLVDIKTSKGIYEKHQMQVEAYRRADGADMGAVLQLGNATKKRYTFTSIPERKRNNLWENFVAIKNLFYTKQPQAQPTIEEFPEKFILPKIES